MKDRRICPECGREVPDRRPANAVVCSPKCWKARATRRKRESRGGPVSLRRRGRSPGTSHCVACGKPNTGRGRGARTCSVACSLVVQRRKTQQWWDEYRQQHPAPEKGDCVVCGKQVPEDKPGTAKTCSPECSAENSKRVEKARRERLKEPDELLPPDSPSKHYILERREFGHLWRVDPTGFWPPCRHDHSRGIPREHLRRLGIPVTLEDFRGFHVDKGE